METHQILLGDYFEDFISKEVQSGRFNSVSEVIKAALRLLETEEAKVRELNNALALGESSKFVADFNPKKHLDSLREKKARTL